MRKSIYHQCYLIVFCCIWFIAPKCMMAQEPAIKPQPIYKQCVELHIGNLDDTTIAKALAGLKEKDAAKRATIINEISASCDSRAVEPLIDMLKDEDATVRIAAIDVLGKLGDLNAVEPLIELTHDKDWRVRLALISALSSFKTFRPKNNVVNGIAITTLPNENESDFRVRCAAILTCNQLADVQFSRKSILFVYNFLLSQNQRIRELAEETMFELKNTRNGINELRAILKSDHNPELRLWAAVWIGKWKTEKGRDILQYAAINDTDARVRQAAKMALNQMQTEQ